MSNFESLLLAEFYPFRIDPPMEPEQERLSKLYSGSGIHSLPELNPNDISVQILPGEFPALADHISMSRTFLRN